MQQNIIWQLQPQYTQERREAEEPSVDDTHIYICISLITIMWNIESVTGSLVELAGMCPVAMEVLIRTIYLLSLCVRQPEVDQSQVLILRAGEQE